MSIARSGGQCERILLVKNTLNFDKYKNLRLSSHTSRKFQYVNSLTTRMVSGREVRVLGYPLGLDEYDTYWPFRRIPGTGF